MLEPNGNEYWDWMDYVKIQPVGYYTALDAFSNAEGEINESLSRAEWLVTFTDRGDNALVETIVTFKYRADFKAVIQMGMQQGMITTLEKLDELLSTLKGKK